jgi:hypothetical protein
LGVPFGSVHTHIGALLAIPAFLSVLLAGTLWRLIAGHLMKSDSQTLQHLAGAMAMQY